MNIKNFNKFLCFLIMTVLILPIFNVISVNATTRYNGNNNTNIWYKSHIQDLGWMNTVTNGETSGTTGKVKNMEAIQISVSGDSDNYIEYTAQTKNGNWIFGKNGSTAGTTGHNLPLVNICIALKDKNTGKDSNNYDVLYRVHVRDKGWLSWTSNGHGANNTGNNIEAIQIQIKPKGISAQAKIVSEAKKHLGKPYQWGATGPNSFDCSGLTQYVYRQALGITLGRTTYDQIKNGREVSQSELQPGDLVFTSADHVAIYIGNGQMIHAPKTGDVVKISSVYKFWRARRIIT